MKNKTRLILVAVAVLGAAALTAQVYAPNFFHVEGTGRAVVPTGGSLDIESGGELDIESGGAIKIAGTAVGSTAAELDKLDGIRSTAYVEVCDGVSYTDDATNTVYTGTVELPSGAWVTDIKFTSTVLWDGTSASLSIGDDDDSDGWFDNVDLKATHMLVGEVLALDDNNWGGANGAYLTTAGRQGLATSGSYFAAASEVIGVVTEGAADGTAGRSFMVVCYAIPTFTAATGTAP